MLLLPKKTKTTIGHWHDKSFDFTRRQIKNNVNNATEPFAVSHIDNFFTSQLQKRTFHLLLYLCNGYYFCDKNLFFLLNILYKKIIKQIACLIIFVMQSGEYDQNFTFRYMSNKYNTYINFYYWRFCLNAHEKGEKLVPVIFIVYH